MTNRKRIQECGFAVILVVTFISVTVPASVAVAVSPPAALRETTVSYSAALQAGEYAALDAADPAVRAATVQAIRMAKDTAAVPALIAHLDDADQRTGLYIAQALAELATDDQLAGVHAALLSTSPDARWRAAYILGERQDIVAIPVLGRALRDSEVLVQRSAAEALAKIGTPAAVQVLLFGLTSPLGSAVNAAMRGLVQIGEPAVPAIAQAMEAGDIRVERFGAIVLAYIGGPEAEAVLHGEIMDTDATPWPNSDGIR